MDSKTKVVVYTVIAVVSMVCMTVAGIFIDADKWAKLARWITDPATGTALVFLVGLVGAAIGRARHMPVSLLVLALLGASVTGCGASALQGQAVGVTVALRVVAAADDVYLADEAHRMEACTDDACITHERAAGQPVEAALDSLRVGVQAWGAAVATAAEADAGAPVPQVVLDAARQCLALWPGIIAAAAALGFALPELPPLLAALVAS